MSQSVAPFRPPLLRAVDEIGLLLDDVADLHPMYLTTSQKQELLVAVERQTSRLAALKAKALAAAGDVADAHGTRHAGAWLAHETRQDPPGVGGRNGSPTGSTNAGRSWLRPTPQGPFRPLSQG